jgi:hypothetical protein
MKMDECGRKVRIFASKNCDPLDEDYDFTLSVESQLPQHAAFFIPRLCLSWSAREMRVLSERAGKHH